MSQNLKQLSYIPNFKKNYIKKVINNQNKVNKILEYSEQKLNDIISISIKKTPKKKTFPFRKIDIPSLTSIISNKISSGIISNYSYSENKKNINNKNPLTIFDNDKSLFTSIDDGFKATKEKDNNLKYNRKRNNSINNLYNNYSFRKNKNNNNNNNLSDLLKKLSSIKYKMELLNNNNKLKINNLKKRKNKKYFKSNEIENIPKLTPNEKNSSYINNKEKFNNIKKIIKLKMVKGRNNTCNFWKDKLPNISIEDNSHYKIKKNNSTVNNIDINRNFKNQKIQNKNLIINFNKTLVTFDKNKEENEIKKNQEFIKKIKNRQLLNLVRRFKICENKNINDEYKSYKKNVFPVNTIKILFSKKKELIIDKFRNEYLLKLENVSLNNY